MMLPRVLATILCAALSALPISAMAASSHGAHHDHADHSAAQTPEAVAPKMVEGTVRKVDKAAGKVTLSHGPLANLGMPAMTMVYRVKDNAWLSQMKEGDKIKFVADKVNGAITMVQFEPAK